MTQDRTSWSIKDTAVLHELVTMMGLSSEETALLGALHAQAQAQAPKMTETFYERLFAHEHTKAYFEGKSMERLHGMIGDWFIALFSGTYDEAYAEHRLTIGAIHVKIGLPVRYPLAMLDVIMPYGEDVARQSPQPDAAVQAFRKVFALDVAIFNQAYEDNQLKHLSDLVGGERLARLLLSGAGS
jgi:hypothetical protein